MQLCTLTSCLIKLTCVCLVCCWPCCVCVGALGNADTGKLWTPLGSTDSCDFVALEFSCQSQEMTLNLIIHFLTLFKILFSPKAEKSLLQALAVVFLNSVELMTGKMTFKILSPNFSYKCKLYYLKTYEIHIYLVYKIPTSSSSITNPPSHFQL